MSGEPPWNAVLRHVAICGVIGLATGLVGAGFRRTLDGLSAMREALFDRMHHAGPVSLLAWCAGVFLLGWGIGFTVRRFARAAAGSGIQDVEAVIRRAHPMRWLRLGVVKFIGGALGIGGGLSLGREGPTVQLGAAVAQAVGGGLRMPGGEIHRLLGVGAGAGLAAAFNAPLAGLAFIFEELRRGIATRNMLGAMVATVSAALVTRHFCGAAPLLPGGGGAPLSLDLVPLLALLGAVAGVGGAILNVALVAAERRAARLPETSQRMLPGFALVAVALVGWTIPDATGDGLDVVQRLLAPGESATFAVTALLLLLVAKFATTVLSYGSGAPGGIFSPMLLIGALTGLVTCRLVAHAVPDLAQHESACALFAMAAIFTASVRAPLTGVLLMIEIAGDHRQVIGLAVASVVAFMTAEALGSRPIYETLLADELGRDARRPG